jgi:hypothetical protein
MCLRSNLAVLPAEIDCTQGAQSSSLVLCAKPRLRLVERRPQSKAIDGAGFRSPGLLPLTR